MSIYTLLWLSISLLGLFLLDEAFFRLYLLADTLPNHNYNKCRKNANDNSHYSAVDKSVSLNKLNCTKNESENTCDYTQPQDCKKEQPHYSYELFKFTRHILFPYIKDSVRSIITLK